MNIAARTVVAATAYAIFACIAGSAQAQDKPADYPMKPIRIIVGIAPGGGLDAVTRAGAQILSDRWGQSVVVDNRPGGGTVIALELGVQAAPDGYTLLMATDTLMVVGAMKRVAFDVRKALIPVAMLTTQPYVLVVNPSVPIRSVQALIAYAKAKPGAVSYGSSGVGTTVHIGMERFALMSGIKLTHVPYKGTAPALVAVIGGEIQMVPASSIAATPQMKAGKVRGIAVTGSKRVPSLPDIPTVDESGVPGYRMTNSYTLYAPAGTPRGIVNAINPVILDGMHSPQMMQRLAADGSQPAERMSPDELRAELAREYLEIEKQVSRLDIKLF
jgi:tripartite-type tricarboxylate transporter receptor subunit TctC